MQNNLTVVPTDLIPVEPNDLKPTAKNPTPLEDRMRFLDILDKRERAPGVTLPPLAGIPLAEYKEKLFHWRTGVQKWATPRLGRFLITNIHKKFPGEVTLQGKPVDTVEEFLYWYKTGQNDNRMREIVNFSLDAVWGVNNQFAINVEGSFMRMLKMKFGHLKSNNTAPQKPAQGKCVQKIIVRKKGGITERIRNTGKKAHKESIYSRTEKASERTTSHNGIPKLERQIQVTKESHGYNGKLGLCAGHDDLEATLKKEKEDTEKAKRGKTPTKTSPVSDDGSVSARSDISTLTPSPTILGGKDVQEFLMKHKDNLGSLEDMMGALQEHAKTSPQKCAKDDDDGDLEPASGNDGSPAEMVR